MKELRVVDAGETGALRSQALWHGIASEMTEASRPTLSFCRPTEPYVGLGYHRRLDEIDQPSCRRRGLPIIRRRLGGGPVYIDEQQLFFQLSMPAARAPARVDLLYRRFLAPAVQALRRLGVSAELRGLNDIAVADRKISGTGAGRIGDGVIVVGNVIFAFPHERMAEVLAFPTPGLARECLRLMRRHVSSLANEGLAHITPERARETLTECYCEALSLTPDVETTTDAEERAIRRWEERFLQPEWLAGPTAPGRTGRQIKISATAWLWAASENEMTLEASITGGRIARVRLDTLGTGGAAETIVRELEDLPAEAHEVNTRLSAFGVEGERIARLLVPGLTLQ